MKVTAKMTLAERCNRAILEFRGRGYGVSYHRYDPSEYSLLLNLPKNTGKKFAARNWLRRRVRCLRVIDGIQARYGR
jgi:hypothetical protein